MSRPWSEIEAGSIHHVIPTITPGSNPSRYVRRDVPHSHRHTNMALDQAYYSQLPLLPDSRGIGSRNILDEMAVKTIHFCGLGMSFPQRLAKQKLTAPSFPKFIDNPSSYSFSCIDSVSIRHHHLYSPMYLL